jgi:hypothetical protein
MTSVPQSRIVSASFACRRGRIKGIAMKCLFDRARIAAMIATAILIAGCAGAPPAPRDDSLLVAAGFKTVVATTERQLQQLPALPPGQVTIVTQTGKDWYVYPDVAGKRVYVGTRKEYQAYLKLRAQNNLSDQGIPPSSYKQDSAMTANSARYAPPPWEGWSEFDVLVWE